MDFEPDNLPLGTVIETSQGRICIHYLADDLLRAYDKFGRDDSPSVRLRSLLPKIASQVPSEQPAPADPAVTDQMANRMGENDLERIAECCLEDVLREKTWGKNQKKSSVAYLDRVVEAGRKSRKAAREADEKRFRDQFGTGGTFGGVVREAQELQSIVGQEGKSPKFGYVDGVKHHIDLDSAPAIAASPAHLAIDPMEGISAEQRRDSAEELEPARATIADRGDLTTQLLTTSALAQAQFFIDFRKASEESNKRAMRVIWIAALSLLATVALSSLSLWYSLRSLEHFEQDRRANNTSSDEWHKKVLEALSARGGRDSARLQALEIESAALRARLEAFENATTKPAAHVVTATPQRKPQRSASTTKRQR